MEKVRFGVLLFMVLISVVSFAQPKLELIETTHDFGKVNEEEGPVMYEFEYENSGDAPLVISYVKASCGCTTPDWTKEPVAPGGRGFVRAQYNPLNRPGNFSKSLRITSNADPSVTYAYIKGSVIPRPKSNEEKYPVVMGSIRVSNTNVNFGRVTDERPAETRIDLFNDSDQPISLLDKYEGPSFIKVSFDTLLIAPKSSVTALISYDPSHDDHLGMQNFGISLYTNESEGAAKNFNVRASVREYFPPMTNAERASAPILSIADKLKNLGKTTQGEVVKVEYVLSNNGQKPLNIRKIDAQGSYVEAKLSDYDIKPGKTAKLEVSFDTKGRRGLQNKTVYIYSNDPVNPTQVVTIRTTIQN